MRHGKYLCCSNAQECWEVFYDGDPLFGDKVTITFTSVTMEGSTGCHHDALEIRDYNSTYLVTLMMRGLSTENNRYRARVTSHSGAQLCYRSCVCTLLSVASRCNNERWQSGNRYQQILRQQPIETLVIKNEHTLRNDILRTIGQFLQVS